ncbi:hypothetical protein [Sporosarcina aquimarina]|nr:hypothetical protein [Sporosarcina aquimarina]
MSRYREIPHSDGEVMIGDEEPCANVRQPARCVGQHERTVGESQQHDPAG